MLHYDFCCVDFDGDLEHLRAMIENAEEVPYKELYKACEGVDQWALDKGYELKAKDGLTLWKDWAVRFNKSTYDGQPCYFIAWSGIEYVWTAKGEAFGFGYYTASRRS